MKPQPLALLLLLLLPLAVSAGGFDFDSLFGPKENTVKTISKNTKHSSIEKSSSNVQRHSSRNVWRSGLQQTPSGDLKRLKFLKSDTTDSAKSHSRVAGEESGSSLNRKLHLVRAADGRVITESDNGESSSFRNKGDSSESSETSSSQSSQKGSISSIKALRHRRRPPQPPPLRRPPHPPRGLGCLRGVKASLIFAIHATSDEQELDIAMSRMERLLLEADNLGAEVSLIFFNSHVVAQLDSSALHSLRSGFADLHHELRGRLSREFNLEPAIRAALRLRVSTPAALFVVAGADVKLGPVQADVALLAAAQAARNFQVFASLIVPELPAHRGEQLLEDAAASRGFAWLPRGAAAGYSKWYSLLAASPQHVASAPMEEEAVVKMTSGLCQFQQLPQPRRDRAFF